jgi:16S rRNA processing protein RimM
MIAANDLLPVAHTQKPYGIRGELMLLFSRREYAKLDADDYFLEIDGIPVPFRVEEITFVTDTTARVKFEDVDDEQTAARYARLEVLLPRGSVLAVGEQDDANWRLFIGYTITNQYGTILGVIEDVDDGTINVLFIVRDGDNEHLIPATDDFIAAVDEKNRILEMYIPEGLIEE